MAAVGIVMTINAIVSGPQAFEAKRYAVVALAVIGIATTIAGLSVLFCSRK
jgi:hypothetical protein